MRYDVVRTPAGPRPTESAEGRHALIDEVWSACLRLAEQELRATYSASYEAECALSYALDDNDDAATAAYINFRAKLDQWNATITAYRAWATRR